MDSINKFIPLSVPLLRGNELEYVSQCIRTEWVSSAGNFVDRFEADLASYVRAEKAVAVSNGTAAIHLALIAAGVSSGDEVFVPALTFIAPVNTIRYVDAEPVFVDCDDKMNISADSIAAFIRKNCILRNKRLMNRKTGRRIRAIIPVHVFGHPADMEKIMDIASENGLKVIEDATESLGSRYISGRYKGKMTGTIGDFGCYSFNGNKIITTGGGGMVVSNHPAACDKIKYLSTQAKDDGLYYIHDNVGYNYRMTNVQAAIGCAQLEKLPEFIAVKRSNFELYKRELAGIDGLSLMEEPAYSFSNYWFYSLVIDSGNASERRDCLIRLLADESIESRPVWKLNHLQRPYRKCPRAPIRNASLFLERILNIPCSVSLKPGDIARVAAVISKGVGSGR